MILGKRLVAWGLGMILAVAAGAQPRLDPVLKAIDDQVTFMESDYSAELTVVQDKPDQGRSSMTLALFRRDRDSKYVMLFLKPEVDKGKGYLKINDSLWFYDPLARRFSVTSAKDKFQNSNARNSDFTHSNLAGDYKIVSTHREKLGVFDTTVYELVAVSDGVTFPRTKLWVTDDNLVRKSEDFSLSGQLLRTTAIPTYQKLKSHYIPVNIVFIDNLRGKMMNGAFVNEKTLITISKPSVEPLPDLVFTQTYLEKVGK